MPIGRTACIDHTLEFKAGYNIWRSPVLILRYPGCIEHINACAHNYVADFKSLFPVCNCKVNAFFLAGLDAFLADPNALSVKT
ncbi:hypothetical protein ES705_51014 [subsurface metagenome]